MAMTQQEIELENFLSNSVFQAENTIHTDTWEAGFNVDRQLIHSKLGLYKKVFLRPEKYIKRFYHVIYPLKVEDWEIIEKVSLYEGFCTMTVTLEIRFQSTFKYAENNQEVLANINEHIKTVYESQLLSLIHNELKTLTDGSWVEKGLGEVEKKIGLLASERLVLHEIQAQVLCALKPEFEEFPTVHIAKENIYLRILKKEFESGEKTQQELFRQETEGEKHSQRQKQLQLQQLERSLEIERSKMALEAENKRLILVEQEGQQIEHFAIEKRLHADKVEHENRLKEIHLEAALTEQKKQGQQEREREQQEQNTILTHKKELAEKQLQADILKYEQEQKHWNKVKERIYSQKQTLKQRRKERNKAQKQALKQQQKALEESKKKLIITNLGEE